MANWNNPLPGTRFCPEQPWFVFNAEGEYSLMVSDNPLISHYYQFSAADMLHNTLAIPDGCVDILFDCDSVNPSARVCGTPLEARHFTLEHAHVYFGVRFAPGVVPRFTGLTAEEMIDGEFMLSELLPEGEAALEAIVKTPDLVEKIATFQRLVLPCVQVSCAALTQSVIQVIRNTNGHLDLAALESRTGYTRRTLQRQFRQDTGMTPKAFSRITRCQSALAVLNQMPHLAFSDLALELGFYDQPHFHREFRKLVNTTPTEYQQRILQERYSTRLCYA
ncbi:helix-turn-helix domain-containing protein [Candidatus Pantoea multigeneris]|uniref:AraC family transcriptional regulator n=1 Tax=Candidatus Pantoea multigeneris TaxID=2608357 RepID=A0ABX0RCQ1_9GAMM|nr:AraC family transcriptional regulator [Pantoea multigeneris]NIF22172.1 AraC family transcriptional regulator [Pantoea multigeneris]